MSVVITMFHYDLLLYITISNNQLIDCSDLPAYLHSNLVFGVFLG